MASSGLFIPKNTQLILISNSYVYKELMRNPIYSDLRRLVCLHSD